jgi:hypothetical protein
VTHGLIDAMGKTPKSPRFVRYKSAAGLVRAFTKGEGAAGGWDAEMSDGTSINLVDSIRGMGFWGFAETATNTIRFWAGKVRRDQLLFFFAHELGHIADEHAKKWRRGAGPNDELRADLYAWVTREATAITAKTLKKN